MFILIIIPATQIETTNKAVDLISVFPSYYNNIIDIVEIPLRWELLWESYNQAHTVASERHLLCNRWKSFLIQRNNFFFSSWSGKWRSQTASQKESQEGWVTTHMQASWYFCLSSHLIELIVSASFDSNWNSLALN